MIRHLFVPGLLGPMPGAGQGGRSLPLLETLLARADRAPEPEGYAAALFALFDVAAGHAGEDLPTAALAYRADTGLVPDAWVLHADPLHLRPDQDRLLAFDLDDHPPEPAEREELVVAFNRHFGADGLSLQAAPGGRLYLLAASDPAIATHPLWDVLGRNIDLFLPRGERAGAWRALLNETQMLCHGLAANGARTDRGLPTLSGLWFSGAGRLPTVASRAIGPLDGACSLAGGLLALAADAGPDPAGVGDAGEALTVEHALARAVARADPAAWWLGLEYLEGRLPGMLAAADTLVLHPCNGHAYRWRPVMRRRFWRRPKPLAKQLDVNPGIPRC